ncbi:MAG: DNA replication/repair protein RecF [Lachnospiraceae bacterium]|nr:DNA replication/repair protein RecF [Lachnospiraceae bacterium]
MLVKSLELSNFRNYDSLSIEFDNNNNILYGDNAQGKTNILEAIHVCGTTKSHKGCKDKELIKINQDEAHIRMIINKNQVDRRIDMHLKKNKTKGVAIDGLPIKKSIELFGLINIVFFSPEDLSIIKDGPSVRRRFIDFELCQLDKIYLHNLSKYNKIIFQRNNLLKQLANNKSAYDTLSVWDEQLVEAGKAIIKRREEFVRDINEIVKVIYSNISGNVELFEVTYEPNVNLEGFSSKLSSQRERDLFQKTTTVGPHRDDMAFLINGTDIRKFGSQGQQRTAALSLKLAEIELVKRSIGENPVLLLDDVLSELDRKRQNYLLNSIAQTQTIITCTGLEEFVNNRFDIDKIYKVVNGQVQEELGGRTL